jgi:hypothetical protein
MPCLASLRLEHAPHLLQFPAWPEALPAALWRLPRLRALSLAGSCPHPSKLKLLGAACGGSLTRLDIGTGGSRGACAVGSGCSSCAACCCPGPQRGAGAGPAGGAAGPAYRRLTALHERDLCEAAACFRALRAFAAAGAALPLRAATAFAAAAPPGRLELLDLRGCCLEAEPTAAAAAHASQPPWQHQLFSSGARCALTFQNYDFLPATAGTSAAHLQRLHAEADSWQRPATAPRFAAALRRHAASLRCLRLGGASGVSHAHLASLPALAALETLCVAGCREAVAAPLLAAAAAGCPRLRRLDLSHTAADDACLAAAAALPRLQELAAAGCRVSGAGVQALAAGPAGAALRWLDLSLTGADDGGAAALAARCAQLRGLLLTGCQQLGPGGVEALGALRRLTCLSLSRWEPLHCAAPAPASPAQPKQPQRAHLAARAPLSPPPFPATAAPACRSPPLTRPFVPPPGAGAPAPSATPPFCAWRARCRCSPGWACRRRSG